MKNLVRRVIFFLRRWKAHTKIPDRDWSNICARNNIPLSKVELTSDGYLLLRLEKNQIRFSKSSAALEVLSAYSRLNQLDAYSDCKLIWDEVKDVLILSWGNATYLANKSEEFYILRELYLSGDYDFTLSGPTVVVDIGANVGFASIFLADLNPDIYVVACEPLKVNYEKALRNFTENPDLAQRITLHNFGLFSDDGEQIITSEVGNRGRSSIIIDRSINPESEAERLPINVKRASTFINELQGKHIGKRIFVKMDCEGSEYTILRCLEADGSLGLIDGFIMEWHKLTETGHEVEEFRSLMKANGYDLYIRGRLHQKALAGMAIAFKSCRQ